MYIRIVPAMRIIVVVVVAVIVVLGVHLFLLIIEYGCARPPHPRMDVLAGQYPRAASFFSF